jgi:Spy/CpxP family protein refolding chaperone
MSGDRTDRMASACSADELAEIRRALLVEVPEPGSCPGAIELAEYIDGAGDAPCREAIECHLAACEACRNAVAHARCGDPPARPRRAHERWMRAVGQHSATWGAVAAAALFAFVAGSASTWWMGSSDMSLQPMATDVARLSPSGTPADAGPMSITRGIILTPTQEAALTAIRERDAGKCAEFHERLEAISVALVRELESSEPDRARIGALVQERYEIMGQRLRLEAGQVRDFCTMLTPDQCARLGRAWLGRHGGHGGRPRGGSGPRFQASPTLPAP